MSADVFKGLAVAADAIGMALALVTGGASVAIGKIAAAAFGAAAGFVEAGKDPVVEIERILSSQGPVEKVHDGWDKRIEDKFGINDDGADEPDDDVTDAFGPPGEDDPYEG